MTILQKIKLFFQGEPKQFNVDRFEEILSETSQYIENPSEDTPPHHFHPGAEVYALFKKNMDFNVISKRDATPLYLSVLYSIPLEKRHTAKSGHRSTETHLRFAPNFHDTLIKNKNVDLNFKNRSGQTILHLLALHPKKWTEYYRATMLFEKWFQRLVEQGADPNIKDNDGNTPFHCAVMGGVEHPGIQYEFVEKGWMDLFWDKTIKNNLGRTPLFCAAANPKINGVAMGYEGDCSIFEYIKNLGWDPTEVDNNGNTVLHVYAQNLSKASAYYEITKKHFNPEDFENVGVEVWKRNNDGQTFFELLKPEICAPEFFDELLEQRGVDQNKHLLECLMGGAEETAPKPKRRM